MSYPFPYCCFCLCCRYTRPTTLMQLSNQPITWKRLSAFRHLSMVKMICRSSVSERGRKATEVTLAAFETLYAIFNLLEFSHMTISRVSRECVKKRKYPLSSTAWYEFLQKCADGRVRIQCKQHESMDSSRLVSTVQAGGVGVKP